MLAAIGSSMIDALVSLAEPVHRSIHSHAWPSAENTVRGCPVQ
jgi:hypothetical protein